LLTVVAAGGAWRMAISRGGEVSDGLKG